MFRDAQNNPHQHESLFRIAKPTRSNLQSLAKVAPLFAAIIAPITSLLDIPALSQEWYTRYGEPQSDYPESLVLSAVSLALNLLANTLLVVRFSVGATRWRLATILSLLCWIAKTIIGVANLIVFGLLSRNADGFAYDEGFWCAVLSVIGAGIISLLLLFQYVVRGTHTERANEEESVKIRVNGQHFMLSVIGLISLLGLQALIFCKIEQWTYLDSIYFSVVTMLTIGFGDEFVPTQVVTKVLLFPIAIGTIAQFGNQISMIIDFFSSRAVKRKALWRKNFEEIHAKRVQDFNPDGTLLAEIAFLEHQGRMEVTASEMHDLVISISGLIIFWTAGAAIFSRVEGWSYGDSFYFSYVTFLTIGFGDFSPQSPAGRVIFIIYALMGVPIVASFAVQTVQKILQTLSERRLNKNKERRLKRYGDRMLTSHAELVLRIHESLGSGTGYTQENGECSHERSKQEKVSAPDILSKSFSERPTSQKPHPEDPISHDDPDVISFPLSDMQHEGESSDNSHNQILQASLAGQLKEEAVLSGQDRRLVKQILQLAVDLEGEARQMILHSLPPGDPTGVLLRADMRLQERAISKLSDINTSDKPRKEETDEVNGTFNFDQRVTRYREIFAELLATGSLLQRLEGVEQLAFERRVKAQIEQEEKDNSRNTKKSHRKKCATV